MVERTDAHFSVRKDAGRKLIPDEIYLCKRFFSRTPQMVALLPEVFCGQPPFKPHNRAMNRLDAAWELIKQDRASEPGNITAPKAVQDVAIKTYDAVSNAVPAVLGFLSDNEFEVKPRTHALSGTTAAIGSTLKARWFNKGNPLNIVPKAITAITEGTDGLIHDVLHIGGGNKNGYVLHTAA